MANIHPDYLVFDTVAYDFVKLASRDSIVYSSSCNYSVKTVEFSAKLIESSPTFIRKFRNMLFQLLEISG